MMKRLGGSRSERNSACRRRPGPSAWRVAERGSLEVQAYDEIYFPGLAAEWVKWDGQRPFVGALTLELATDTDDEIAHLDSLPEHRRSASASAACPSIQALTRWR